jgi:competence protein ComEC
MIDRLPEAIVLIYDEILRTMNKSIYWIARKENFIFENITFSGLLLVMSYALVFWIKKSRQKNIIHLLYGLLALQTLILIQNYNTSNIYDF